MNNVKVVTCHLGEFHYKSDLFHNEDGPAIIYIDGIMKWYLDGEVLTFEEWCKKLNKTEAEIFELVLRFM